MASLCTLGVLYGITMYTRSVIQRVLEVLYCITLYTRRMLYGITMYTRSVVWHHYVH